MPQSTKKLEIQNKIQAYAKFRKLAKFLNHNLGSHKTKIVKTIQSQTPKGREREGRFIKSYLKPSLEKYFSLNEYPIRAFFEGINSQGKTQFKNVFFGSKPAPDFILESTHGLFKTYLFPLNTVGEIKYDKLTFRNFATGLGQIIAYLESSKIEQHPKLYGYYIYFNTDGDNEVSNNEEEFLKALWERENIFTVII